MIIKFYIPKSAVNDATSYYVRLIEKALVKSGNKVIVYNKLFKPNNNDIIFVIRLLDFFILRLMNRNVRIMSWFQGIPPEECELIHGKSLKGILGKIYFTFLERYMLKKSFLHIFVSEKMKDHFECKYKLSFGDRYIVIPCYNKELQLDAFDFTRKYENFDFVYAGGLYAWQCINQTLLIFKEVVLRRPEARLTILTNETEKANSLVLSNNVSNVTVGYVKLDKLQDELTKYKYGFLYRENHIVNNVSTPTKMNSYLAAGVIPIYTNVVDSFEKNIDLKGDTIKFTHSNSNSFFAETIIKHHECLIDIGAIKNTYSNVFNVYYNDDLYIERFNILFNKLIL